MEEKDKPSSEPQRIFDVEPASPAAPAAAPAREPEPPAAAALRPEAGEPDPAPELQPAAEPELADEDDEEAEPGEGEPVGAPPAAVSGAAAAAPAQGQRAGRRRRRRRRGGGGQNGPGGPAQAQGQTPPAAAPQSRQPAPPPQRERRERHEQRQESRQERRDRHDRNERHEPRREREREQREVRPEDRRRDGRPRKPVKREILANTSFEETRVAIIEDGRLAELLWERRSEESIVGNIYKGQVENVLPGISSAFVNIGYEKNAYLYISDVLGERNAPIDQTLKKGQNIMVQVAKEAIGTKGMKVTMDVSLPGRYLVFTPLQNYVGISKHIEDAEERKRLSAIVDSLVATVLGGRGLVVRTEAEGASAEELEREVRYLLQTWEGIQKAFESKPAPALLHKDLDLTLQVARDVLSDQVYVYLIDNKDSYKAVLEFLDRISPELKDRVRLYEPKTPIFKAFNIEPEIENLRKTKVPLPNGGSIIIQEAESLCAIDVNTGRFTGSKSQEETVTATNIEAAQEIAHQLRLRNIGGIIVVDFIDMKRASNRQKVVDAFAASCRNDRAKIRILPITRLGLVELTRERKRESTVSLITDECPECKGAGRVLSAETLRIRIQREIYEMTGGRPGGQVRLLLHPALADIFRNQQRHIEKNVQRSVKIQGDPQLTWEDYRIVLE